MDGHTLIAMLAGLLAGLCAGQWQRAESVIAEQKITIERLELEAQEKSCPKPATLMVSGSTNHE